MIGQLLSFFSIQAAGQAAKPLLQNPNLNAQIVGNLLQNLFLMNERSNGMVEKGLEVVIDAGIEGITQLGETIQENRNRPAHSALGAQRPLNEIRPLDGYSLGGYPLDGTPDFKEILEFLSKYAVQASASKK